MPKLRPLRTTLTASCLNSSVYNALLPATFDMYCSFLALSYKMLRGAFLRGKVITEAAGKLQREGFINYRRGHISVLDRQGLESTACECYAVVKKEIHRLLSDVQYRQSA